MAYQRTPGPRSEARAVLRVGHQPDPVPRRQLLYRLVEASPCEQTAGGGGGHDEDESNVEEHDPDLLIWIVLRLVEAFAVNGTASTANEKNEHHAPSANLTLWVISSDANVSSKKSKTTWCASFWLFAWEWASAPSSSVKMRSALGDLSAA